MKGSIVLSALCLVAQAHVASAFAPIQQLATSKSDGVAAFATHQMKSSRAGRVVLSMSDGDGNDSMSSEMSAAEVSAAAPSSPPAASPIAESKSDVPLDVPSPILLAGSMVLAIVSTGSIFELLGGSPQYGMVPTALFAVVGTPLCFFLFYAAILKGNAMLRRKPMTNRSWTAARIAVRDSFRDSRRVGSAFLLVHAALVLVRPK